jgi:DNA gyrase/topoisomerase IV subunit A
MSKRSIAVLVVLLTAGSVLLGADAKPLPVADRVSRLEKQNAGLTTALAQLGKENTDLKTELARLGKEDADLKTDLAEMRKQMEAVRATLDELRKVRDADQEALAKLTKTVQDDLADSSKRHEAEAKERLDGTGVVKARDFQIIDRAGKCVGSFGLDAGGDANLVLLDHEGKSRMVLGFLEGGGCALYLSPPDEKPRLVIRVDGQGIGEVLSRQPDDKWIGLVTGAVALAHHTHLVAIYAQLSGLGHCGHSHSVTGWVRGITFSSP